LENSEITDVNPIGETKPGTMTFAGIAINHVPGFIPAQLVGDAVASRDS
jgi:hypothetical protein